MLPVIDALPGFHRDCADGQFVYEMAFFHDPWSACSDEGRLAEVVLEPVDATGQALVRTAKGEEWVDVTVLGEVAPNDLVLVHAGTAIARLGDERSREEQRADTAEEVNR